MQYTDIDIDVALDDREPVLIYEVNPWIRLYKVSLLSLLLPTFVVMWADVTDRQEWIAGGVVAFLALVCVVVFALVMAYRADHRAPAGGGYGA